MKNSIYAALIVFITFALFCSVSLAEENDDLIFTYNHDGLECGQSRTGQEKENNFKVEDLPKFSDYPAEEKSDKLLTPIQIGPEWQRLVVNPDTKYSANFNGHYLVVYGNAPQCTGCAYAEIIDTNTEKKLGRLNVHMGRFPTKFKLNSSLIIENPPQQGFDLCGFNSTPFVMLYRDENDRLNKIKDSNSMPPVIFYQVKNDKLIKIKELKLLETEEYKKMSSSQSEGSE